MPLLCALTALAFSSAYAKGQNPAPQRTGKKSDLERVLNSRNPTMQSTREKDDKTKENPGRLPPPFLNERREREESKARGVIVKFHLHPDSEEQKEITKRLQAGGLKKTKSIRSFQTLLFEWAEGGLKPSRLGEEACKKLKDLSNVKRCNPDILLPLNQPD